MNGGHTSSNVAHLSHIPPMPPILAEVPESSAQPGPVPADPPVSALDHEDTVTGTNGATRPSIKPINGAAPALDLTECAKFIELWSRIADTPHVTLTAITPDGPTTTATFTKADTKKATPWIKRHQDNGRNIYFQVNETPDRCVKKPNKEMM
jgi:hypothetical protein